MARRVGGEYAWETQYEKSWDLIQEDPTTGRLSSSGQVFGQNRARKSRLDASRYDITLQQDGTRKIRRGMMRCLTLCIDMSRNANHSDMRPSRGEVLIESADEFIKEFYDQNPISQLALVATRNGVAEILSPLGAHPKAHSQALQNALKAGSFGEASLQNTLLCADSVLQSVPSHASREILILYASLSTCDPGDVYSTVDDLEKSQTRVSVVNAAGAELHVLSATCLRTRGEHIVALHELHLRTSLMRFLNPPPTWTSSSSAAALVRMGFPVLQRLEKGRVSANERTLCNLGYECPRCGAWLSDVPIECTLCALPLLSSPHLARSYHHLFPIPLFSEVKPESVRRVQGKNDMCYACLRGIHWSMQIENGIQADGNKDGNIPETKTGKDDNADGFWCVRCGQVFCYECDVFIHDALHSCPGCENQGKLLYE